MADPKPSEITSRPPLVDVSGERATPPGIVYISRDDKLYVRSSSASGAPAVILSGRLLGADGVIREFRFDVTLGANFNIATRELGLAEGFLLSVAATLETTTVLANEALVEVGIVRGRLADRHIVHVLFRDFLSTGFASGWPPGRIAPVLEWPGAIRAAGGVDPAAGVEFSITIGADRVQMVRCLRITLVTDVTAVSRQVALEFVIGGAVVWRSEFFDAQTASLTRAYNWAVGGEFGAAARNAEYVGYIPEIYLAATDVVRTSTLNLQVGDDYGGGAHLLHSWFQD